MHLCAWRSDLTLSHEAGKDGERPAKKGKGKTRCARGDGSNICSRNTRTRERTLLVLDPLTYRDSQSADMQLPGNFCSLTGVEFALGVIERHWDTVVVDCCMQNVVNHDCCQST